MQAWLAQDDLYAHPQNPCERWAYHENICNPSTSMGRWNVEKGESLDAHEPASLAHTTEKKTKCSCLFRQGRSLGPTPKVILWPLLVPWHTSTCSHTQKCTHIYCIYEYIHGNLARCHAHVTLVPGCHSWPVFSAYVCCLMSVRWVNYCLSEFLLWHNNVNFVFHISYMGNSHKLEFRKETFL